MTGVRPANLVDHHLSDLFRRDVLHLPHGRDGHKLTRGEHAVLARVDDRNLELALLRVALDRLREVQRTRLRDLDRLRLEEIVVSVLVAGRAHFYAAVSDHGRGLHFLDDGRVGGAREQEEQAGWPNAASFLASRTFEGLSSECV